MPDHTRERDLVLAPNEFAFISDQTKGNINVYVGPYKTSLANTDQPVVFNERSKMFERCNLDAAIQVFPTAPEGWYVVLKNPPRDAKPPKTGTVNGLNELDVGRKVNLPGPISFSLWPGQMARVIQGHRLRSNQYVLVRVYDAVAALANWSQVVMNAGPAPADLAIGTTLVIRGTDVAFYIPPTGVEVVRDAADEYVRDAVTLERLEYCILLDENGNKRFIQGPAVVFPAPTETFVERRIRGCGNWTRFLMSTTGKETSSPRVGSAFVEDVVLPHVSALLDLVEHAATYPEVDLDLAFEASHRAFEADVLSSTSGPLQRLAERLGLDTTDRLILLLAAAPYLDERFKDRLRGLQRSVLADRCTVGLAMRLTRRGEVRRLELLARFDPDRPLFSSGLVRLDAPLETRTDAVLERVLVVPRRTLDLLLGLPRLDDRARAFCTLERPSIPLERVVLPPDRLADVLRLVRSGHAFRRALARGGFDAAIPYGRALVLLFSGPPGTGKTLLARAVAHRLGRPLLRARADHLAEADGPVEEAIDALFQDASLHDAILFFDECEALFGQRGARLGTLLQAIEAFDGVLLLATNLPERLDPAVERRIVHRVDFELPAPAEREQIWEMHLPPEADIAPDVDIPLLSNLFNLSGGAIKNAVLAALSAAVDLDPERPTLDMALLRRAAEGQTRSKLEGLAERSRVNLRLADLVLPDEEHRKVAEIAAACRNKDLVQNRWGLGRRLTTGRGIAILFDGPPGTGKTLCAELLAAELGRPLYRVHIPNVVSKWVGETEKNISEIFARARSVQSVLLFDEADSLFSARTEVRSSNDRFANQEVNLLLQEIERSDGIVILTTNLFGGLDEALRRRIQYRVTFPMPGAAERARIWERLVPAETPLAADVNFERMGALYEFAGGAIKNAVVRASYRAWEDGGGLTQGHLIDAGRVECEALGIAVRTGLASVPRRSLDAAQAPVASAVGRGA